jgi:hypothetical protein
MTKKENNQYPFSIGYQHKKTDFNSYEEGSRVPEVVKEEEDINLFFSMIGEQYYSNHEASKRKKLENQNFLELTKLEKESEEKKNFLAHLGVNPNPLRYATKFKVSILYIVIGLGMVGEFFIYQNIAFESFAMPEVKSYFIGFSVLLFTKFIQVAIQKHITSWIKENNLLFRSVHKTLIFVLVGMVLINAVMMGITNLNNIEKQKKIEKMEYVSSSIDDAQDYGENTADLDAELSALEAEIYEDESWFIIAARYISIGFLGLISIGAGAILFVVADLNKDAISIKNKIQQLKDRQAELKANLPYYVDTYNELLSLQHEIIKSHGIKHFLEKLLSEKQEEALKIKSE